MSMAAAFTELPCKVLWRLTRKEVPDAVALAALNLGNNTQVSLGLPLTLWSCAQQEVVLGWEVVLSRVWLCR